MRGLMERIALDAAGGYNRLWLDFCARPSAGIPGHLRGVGGDRAAWLDTLESVGAACGQEDGGTWRHVVDDVASLSRRLGAREEVLERLEAAGRREAFFVVTGQQPGAFGGPLLALYKAFTAVATAAVLEKITSRPFVPLYWCGADDADFQEIRSLSLVTRNSTPISTAIAQQAHSPGLPAGDIGVEWLRQVWKNVLPFVADFERAAFVTQAVDDAFAKARDHGEHAAALLVGLTGGALAVVDGRSPSVRRHAQPVIVDYVRDEDAVKSLIVDGGRRLERAGYHAQLAVGEDSGIFLVENGLRKNVTRERRPGLVETARSAVERCSPGVAARNLVQDSVFKPVAVVLGPAEVAYRAQLSALYSRFGIGVPVPVPRLTATFVPADLADILAGGGSGGVTAMVHDPGEFVRSLFERALPGSLRDAARELDARVTEAAEAYWRAVEAVARPKAASRVRARIADLKNRSALAAAGAAEIGKALALERWPFLNDLVALVKPGGKPQERTLSSLAPYLFGGASAGGDLRGAADAYVDDLLDGRTKHIVYSPST
jgi:bacillithiol synthase